MATYVNNLRLKEIATGDSSGTWGDETNTNLELIGQAFGYGTRAIADASTDNITIADGASDSDRSMYLKLTGGGQACTVSLLPNTASKIYIMENATAYTLTFSQGSGANVAVLAGEVKVIAGDGLGSGAVVYDLLTDVNLAGTTKVDNLTAGGTSTLAVTDVTGAASFAADTTFADGADIITASAGTSNLRLGVNAGNSIESGGNYNTVVGDEAGTAITTGDDNAAFGMEALKTATTATKNTALGRASLKLTTTGASNTAVGYAALFSNTTASNNTAVGDQALFANTTADNNTAVGFSAGAAITTGVSNVAVGALALDANTSGGSNTTLGAESLGANTTGGSNVALGRWAMAANTTASENVGIGVAALSTNTTGTANVAVGYLALNANTTASNNTAVGLRALTANTTASNNTAVGYSALSANTTAGGNVAVGYLAMQDSTTAANATAVGYEALANNTTSNGNHAFGFRALKACTTGSSNTAVGGSAGTAITTGVENTFVGATAGDAVTTGRYNVCVGYNSGTYSTDLITGDGSICIGSYSRASTTDADYAIAIGYNINGTAGYTTLGQSGSDIRAAHGVATWATVSDERYKKDIEDCTTGLSFINSLRSVTWNYKTLGELPETFNAYEEGSTEVFKNTLTNHGLIAQHTKEAIDADSGLKDGFKLWDEREDGSQEVAEAALIPILVKAIQELTARLEALEA